MEINLDEKTFFYTTKPGQKSKKHFVLKVNFNLNFFREFIVSNGTKIIHHVEKLL